MLTPFHGTFAGSKLGELKHLKASCRVQKSAIKNKREKH